MTNWYLKAIYAESEEERIEALRQFFVDEVERLSTQLAEHEPGDGRWGYVKGRRDQASTALSLVFQMEMHTEMEGPDEQD